MFCLSPVLRKTVYLKNKGADHLPRFQAYSFFDCSAWYVSDLYEKISKTYFKSFIVRFICFLLSDYTS